MCSFRIRVLFSLRIVAFSLIPAPALRLISVLGVRSKETEIRRREREREKEARDSEVILQR